MKEKLDNGLKIYGAVVGTIALAMSCVNSFNLFHLKDGHLIEMPPLPAVEEVKTADRAPVKKARHRPNGNNFYTLLGAMNDRDYEITVKRVDFKADGPGFKTPNREHGAGVSEPLIVNFTNFNPKTLVASFPTKWNAHPVKGHEELPIGVVILDKKLQGMTYIGTLTFHTSRDPLVIKDVEIDVLSQAPTLPEPAGPGN